MGPFTKGEATAPRGGLRARVLAFLAHPALHRVVALTIGLGALGAMGQCLGAPASAASVATSPPTSATAFGGSLATPAASVVTPPSPSPSTSDAGAGAGPVDLNTASADDLRRLPGIGPKRANAIVELRAKLGGFKKLEDLLRVRGIGRAAMKRLRPLVGVGPLPAKS